MTAAVRTVNTQQSSAEVVTVGWTPLYQLGGIAAILTVLFIPVAIYVFMTWPQPTTVAGWYLMFQNNRLIALIDMDLLIVLSNAISIPITLSLYVLLRRTNKSFTAIALALSLVAVATYFASNPVLTMITLSNQYAAATTDPSRSMLLAAGQAMLASYQGTAFWVSNALAGISLLIMSIVMLRSSIFSKATAYVGIVANIVGFGLFIPSQVGIFISIIGVIGLAIWDVMIARKLFQLARQTPNDK